MADPTSIFTKVPDMNYEEPLLETNPEEFGKIIKNRRSVRFYTNEKVPKHVMEQVLEWGLLAPNSSNLQAWEFYWVKQPTKKSLLVEALFNQPAARSAQELIVCVGKLNTWKKTRKDMLELFAKSGNVPESAKAYYEKLVPMAYTQGPLSVIGYSKKIVTTVVGLFRPVPSCSA